MWSANAHESLDWTGAHGAVTDWPCLDLVNSIEWLRLRDQVEFLRDYGDVVRWARHEGLLADQEARRLLGKADKRPHEAATIHERVITLRHALRAVFSAIAHRAPPPPADLDRLNAELAQAIVPARLVWTDEEGFRREWVDPRDELGWVLGPTARSAAELLTSPALGRLKECPGSPGKACGYLFIDETRNRSRRWCSGATCGNRTRLHRHFARLGAVDPRGGD